MDEELFLYLLATGEFDEIVEDDENDNSLEEINNNLQNLFKTLSKLGEINE